MNNLVIARNILRENGYVIVENDEHSAEYEYIDKSIGEFFAKDIERNMNICLKTMRRTKEYRMNMIVKSFEWAIQRAIDFFEQEFLIFEV